MTFHALGTGVVPVEFPFYAYVNTIWNICGGMRPSRQRDAGGPAPYGPERDGRGLAEAGRRGGPNRRTAPPLVFYCFSGAPRAVLLRLAFHACYVPRIQHQKLAFLGVSHSAFGAPIVYAIPHFSLDHRSLSVRRERPRDGRTAEKRDEVAPFHD